MLMRNLHMLCEIQRTTVARKIWRTSQSPLSTFYISFLISGSQESNASNGVQFGAEMKKLWPIEGNCAKLKRNFVLTFPHAKIFALTFPDAKIFALKTQCKNFRINFLQCKNIIVKYFTPTPLDFYLRIFRVIIYSLLVIS